MRILEDGVKASETIVVWNPGLGENNKRSKDRPWLHSAPPGALALGPFENEYAWSDGYLASGGASWVARRKLRGMAQMYESHAGLP
jgi:hypothetical protein